MCILLSSPRTGWSEWGSEDDSTVGEPPGWHLPEGLREGHGEAELALMLSEDEEAPTQRER